MPLKPFTSPCSSYRQLLLPPLAMCEGLISPQQASFQSIPSNSYKDFSSTSDETQAEDKVDAFGYIGKPDVIGRLLCNDNPHTAAAYLKSPTMWFW